MQPELPFVSCLCPTYLRPKLLENAIACFDAQDYPADRRELIILDDAGQICPQRGGQWEVVSISRRFHSLPEKFNAIAGMARGDILVVWEDDDIYLPWHITAHVQSLKFSPLGPMGFSKPSKVLSTYTGKPEIETADGRFHASVAFTREAFDRAGGWPITKAANFDQQFLSRMMEQGIIDTCRNSSPSYVFRWGSTNAYHGQAFMLSPDDDNWYQRVRAVVAKIGGPLAPRLDEETAAVIQSATR